MSPQGEAGSDGVERPGRLHQLLESVVTSATDAVLITDADTIEEREGGPRIVYANDAFERMTGYQAGEVVGLTPRVVQCQATDAGDLRRIRQALSEWRPIEVELENRRKDGRHFWVQVAISPAFDDGGRCTHWVSIQRDVTARRAQQAAAEQALRIARRRLTGAFEHAPIGMALTSTAGLILAVNPALADLLGRPADELVGATMFDLTHEEDQGGAAAACSSLNEHGGTSRQECRFKHADGHHMDVIVHASLVVDDVGAPEHIVMHVQDVSDRNRLERQLLRRATHDAMTKLPNRTMVLDRLGQALARRNRDGSALALLFLDIDGFKAVNDRDGHVAGDRLLVELAGRYRAALRPGDTVARFGGDEFVCLCEHTDAEQALLIADRLADATLRSAGDARESQVSASIGIAIAAGSSPVVEEELVKDADAAMYEAKALGGNRRVVFDAALRRRDGQRRATELGLRDAIRDDHLRLHYQPQVDLSSGATVGVEALVRWQHEERGLLMPEHFVAPAERSELIVELGEWVLRQACADAARESELRPTWVNVSARQFGADLREAVARALEQSGLPAASLGLEVTESVLMHDLDTARVQLERLKQLGVQLAIDDFGTGYSSLAYLAALPVDVVKIDRSFTAHLYGSGPGRAVITAVLGMAEAFGLRVVAEGVETDVQHRELRSLGVPVAQGFLLGRPKAAQDGRPPGGRS